MPDETPEQIKNHRDQLKLENDRLNPLVDGQKQQIEVLTNSTKAAQESAREAIHQRDQASASLDDATQRTVELGDELSRSRAAQADMTSELFDLKQKYNARCNAFSIILKIAMDEAAKIES